MSAGVIGCLLEAVSAASASRVLSSAEQQEVLRNLTKEITELEGNAQQQAARAFLKQRLAARQLFEQTVSRTKADANIASELARVNSLDAAAVGHDWASRIENVTDSPTNRPGMVVLAETNKSGFNAELLEVIEAIHEKQVGGLLGYAKNAVGEQVRVVLNGGKSNSPIVNKLAKQVRAWMDRTNNEARQFGRFVEQRADYWPLRHNFERVQLARAEWEAYLVQHLDPVEFPAPAAYARKLYDNLAGKTGLLPQEVSSFQLPRYTKFRTPEALAEYQRRFGPGDFADELRVLIEERANELAALEVLGPQPDRFLTEVKSAIDTKISTAQTLAANAGDTARAKALQESTKITDNAFKLVDVIIKPQSNPSNAAFASWARAAFAFGKAFKLGKSVVANVVFDPVILFTNQAQRTGLNFSTLGRVVGGYAEHFATMGDFAKRRWLEDMSVATNSLVGTVLERARAGEAAGNINSLTGTRTLASQFGANAGVKAAEAGAAATTWVLRVTGATATAQATHSVAALMSNRALAEAVRGSWADVRPSYRKILEGAGITARDWPGLQVLPVRQNGALDFTAAAPALRTLAHTAMVREGRMMVNLPSIWERQRLGTFNPETSEFSTLVKLTSTSLLSWPMAFVHRSMARQIKLGGAPAIGFFAGIAAAAVFQIQLRAATDGKPTYDWTNRELWLRGLLQSGVLGPYADMVSGAVGEARGPSGPIPLSIAAEFGKDMVEATNSFLDDDAGRGGLFLGRAASDLAPNLWYLDAIVNRVVRAAAADLDPDYERYYMRTARDRGENFFGESE